MFLNGILPALITPFKEDGEINYESLRKLVKLNLRKGVSGFYVGGSTAEAFMLTTDERKKILETVVDEVNGQAKVIAHVGAIDTRLCIELAEHAKTAGANAVSAIPPFYYKFTFEEIKEHYRKIATSTDLPFIIYNFPKLSGVEFTLDNILELSNIQNIIGMKHTSFDLFQMQKIKSILPDFEIYCSHDEIYLAGRSMGSDAAIGSTYNLMAERYIEIEDLYQKGNMKLAKQKMNETDNILFKLVKGGQFNSLRYILNKNDIPCGQSRSPFGPISEETKNELDELTFDLNV